MTDAEIVKTIAEKVMGYCVINPEQYEYAAGQSGDHDSGQFNPLTNDNDCMAAFDKCLEVCEGTALLSGLSFIVLTRKTGAARRKELCAAILEEIDNE